MAATGMPGASLAARASAARPISVA
jgi:hypothetical protein